MPRRTTTAEVAAKIFGKRVVAVIDAGGRAATRQGWYRLAPLAELIGFEADGAECDRLNRAAAVGSERYEQAILGDAEGSAEIFLCERPDVAATSAPCAPLVERFTAFRDLKPRGTSLARVRRIDVVARLAGVDEIAFARLCCWGGEMAAIAGFGALAGGLLGVEVDVAFAPIFERQPLFHEIDAVLRSSGLTFWRLRRPVHACERNWSRLSHAEPAFFGGATSSLMAGSGRLLAAQALYLRDHASLPAASPADLLRLAALASICDACGEIDMTVACLQRILAQRHLLDEPARLALSSHLRQVERE